MRFRSDNASGMAPCVLDALTAIADRADSPYGADTETARCRELLAELFERDLHAFLVATGTAANALALGSVAGPGTAIFCHEHSHINVDEAGAPEFFTNGAKLIALAGENGKIDAAALERALQPLARGSVHQVEPKLVSITQPTEWGTCYAPEEIGRIAAVAHRHGLSLHMDGARFANAVAHSGCPPAAISWRAGVDLMSFGATKNGALAAEAVLFFNGCPPGFARARKRAGQLLSKGWLIAAQLNAGIEDGDWLRLAAHANHMAGSLARRLSGIPGVALIAPVEANLVFVRLPGEEAVAALRAAGAQFLVSEWTQGTPVLRLVTSHATRTDEVDSFVELVSATLGA
jgi:threonine aldolase